MKFLITFLMISCFCLARELTIEEKVGQIMMCHFNGEIANEDARFLIQDLHIGGIIYYRWANVLSSPEQVKKLSASIQEIARIPLFIAIDQEGGRVTRLKEGFTIFPAAKTFTDPNEVKKAAFIMGQEMKNVGINLNLAPVVDVDSNPLNPVIGDRSYSNDPNKVVCLARKAIEGFHEAGLMTCIKHFPGYGDVQIDPHEGLPVVNKTIEQLEETELVPFRQLSESDAIMVAHIMMPALDKVNCTTFSKKSLDFLKEDIGFSGLIISDSLVMNALPGSIEEIAIKAFNAGCDILLFGGKLLNGSNKELTPEDLTRVHKTLVAAIKSGVISEARLNFSIQKILSIKSNRIS